MSADKLTEAREAAESSLGFKIPDVVATSVLWYARRKCELAEQPEIPSASVRNRADRLLYAVGNQPEGRKAT